MILIELLSKIATVTVVIFFLSTIFLCAILLIIAGLLLFHPGSCLRDSQGRLPLNIALERDATNVNLEAVRLLCECNPQSLQDVSPMTGKTALRELVEDPDASESCLYWLVKYCPASMTKQCDVRKMLSSSVVKPNQIEASMTPIELSIHRDTYLLTRAMLLANPKYDWYMLKNLNWKVRRIVFGLIYLTSNRDESRWGGFSSRRPSVQERLERLSRKMIASSPASSHHQLQQMLNSVGSADEGTSDGSNIRSGNGTDSRARSPLDSRGRPSSFRNKGASALSSSVHSDDPNRDSTDSAGQLYYLQHAVDGGSHRQQRQQLHSALNINTELVAALDMHMVASNNRASGTWSGTSTPMSHRLSASHISPILFSELLTPADITVDKFGDSAHHNIYGSDNDDADDVSLSTKAKRSPGKVSDGSRESFRNGMDSKRSEKSNRAKETQRYNIIKLLYCENELLFRKVVSFI
jgi:hypothetical protein